MKGAFAEGRPIDFQVILLGTCLPLAGLTCDEQDVCARFTLDSATEFLFGDCVDSIHEPSLLPHYWLSSDSGTATPALTTTQSSSMPVTNRNTSSTSFVRSFGAAQDIISRRVRVGYAWPALETFTDLTAEHRSKIREYLQPILERALEKKRGGIVDAGATAVREKAELGEGVTLLDYLVHQTEDKDIIRDSLMNMLIAGRDTVSP